MTCFVRAHRQSTPFFPKQISHCTGEPSLGASGPRSSSKGAQGTDEKRKLISRNTTILRSCLYEALILWEGTVRTPFSSRALGTFWGQFSAMAGLPRILWNHILYCAGHWQSTGFPVSSISLVYYRILPCSVADLSVSTSASRFSSSLCSHSDPIPLFSLCSFLVSLIHTDSHCCSYHLLPEHSFPPL